jgi:3alpha(or 20beta)-hydroxysteroid dehydrogenase
MVLDQAHAGHDGDRFLGNLPLAGFAEPAEISRLVAYVASDEASYSTGSESTADGGLLSGPGY